MGVFQSTSICPKNGERQLQKNGFYRRKKMVLPMQKNDFTECSEGPRDALTSFREKAEKSIESKSL